MKRRHDMPFGAECRQDGSVRFRLWAPAARHVEILLAEVCLADSSESRRIPLEPRDDGWFELVTDAAGPGTEYRFRIDERQVVPDPASRFQPRDVHGPSQIIDPDAFDWQDVNWQDTNWQGRPWEETVIYEAHVGTFTPQGTFAALSERFDYLSDLGITALELMPVADFPGQRNWGYDGVLPFAPDSSYGRPEDLKTLIQLAHARGIMVFLDVVYNHFGPEGNYLGSYAPQFFTDRHRTPWGDAINFDGPGSRIVRDFFIHNALYWLHEYHFDGLRFDAVHAIADDSTPDILAELAQTVRESVPPGRHVHLILENDRNQSHYLRRASRSDFRGDVRSDVRGNYRNDVQQSDCCQPTAYTAQWNDDIHHALHVLLTGEHDGYYCDYYERPRDRLLRCLAEGFDYQGEPSRHRNGERRGEPTEGLPPTAFVSFLQNHDQVGNRAFGERITTIADPRAIAAAMAILLLAPSPPMLFMGEEFGAETSFLYFCDYKGDLAAAVTAGRRGEFAHFAQFTDPAERDKIPDPNAITTFEASRISWDVLLQPPHQKWFDFYRQLLKLRREHIIPRLSIPCRIGAECSPLGDRGLRSRWRFPDNSELTLIANLGAESRTGFDVPRAPIIYTSDETDRDSAKRGTLPAWSVAWFLQSCLLQS
jgi:maltooligosyltrehalose trehalohydrolase